MGIITNHPKTDIPSRESENVVRPIYGIDISLYAFQLAWQIANKKEDKILRPKDIYIGFNNRYTYDLYIFVNDVLTGDLICIHDADDPDEWWMTFEDSDLIFYSPGA